MTDRELLELAAKAVDYLYVKEDPKKPVSGLMLVNWEVWNPLTDDGDALRLAVELSLAVTPYPVYDFPKHAMMVRIIKMPMMREEGELQIETIEPYSNDQFAATRRAIVRAAAELGKGMK